MKSSRLDTNLILILGLIGMLMAPKVMYAENSSQAKVLDIKGEASFMKAGSSVWNKLEPTTMLAEGDAIKTGMDSEVKLELMGVSKTAELLIQKETEFKFDMFRHDEATKVESTLLNVDVGSILIKAEKLMGDSKFEVKTPTSIVGIRGTVFEVHVPKA